MQPPDYRFVPVTEAHLPLLARWLGEPHVRAWWGDPDEQLALLTEDLAGEAMAQHLVALGDCPFGYVQDCRLDAWPRVYLAHLPQDARAMDVFVGDPAMLGQGHGSGVVRAWATHLLAGGAPMVVIDPDPENARALAAYRRAGFAEDRLVEAEDGPALLMRLERAEGIRAA